MEHEKYRDMSDGVIKFGIAKNYFKRNEKVYANVFPVKRATTTLFSVDNIIKVHPPLILYFNQIQHILCISYITYILHIFHIYAVEDMCTRCDIHKKYIYMQCICTYNV